MPNYNTCSIHEIHFYSNSCLHEMTTQCRPDIRDIWFQAAGIWCIINSFFGMSGNLLTLLAIPYASKHKRFGLHRNWNTTTIFILNLAAADFLYCCINLPMYAVQYLSSTSSLTTQWCYSTTAFRYVNAFADWMSLGMIALSRCISLIWPKFSNKFSTGLNGKIVIFFIWLYANLLLIPIYLKDSYDMGTFGYNCRLGKCDFIPSENGDAPSPQIIFFGIGFTIPCCMVTISYFVIWRYARTSSHYLRQSGHDVRRQVNHRDLKMTWTIFMVCFCYFIFVMPVSVLNMFDSEGNLFVLQLVAFCIYWFQYSLNFFIYAARSEQYRKAYVYFLARVKFICVDLVCCCLPITTTTTSSHVFFIDQHVAPDVLCQYKPGGSRIMTGPRESLPLSVFHEAHRSCTDDKDKKLHHCEISNIMEEPSAVIIMAKSKTRRIHWKRCSFSLTDRREPQQQELRTTASSSFNLTWMKDDEMSGKVELLQVKMHSPRLDMDGKKYEKAFPEASRRRRRQAERRKSV